MEPLCSCGGHCSWGNCPGVASQRGGHSRGRRSSGEHGNQENYGGWGRPDSDYSGNYVAGHHQYSGDCGHVNYPPQAGVANYNGAGAYVGPGHPYYGGSDSADFRNVHPSGSAFNGHNYNGCGRGGYTGVGRGGGGRGHGSYPAYHGAARRGRGYSGNFRGGKNGGAGNQDYAGRGNVSFRGQRGTGRRGVGRRGASGRGRGTRGGSNTRGRSASSRRSDKPDDNDDEGKRNPWRKNDQSKQRPLKGEGDKENMNGSEISKNKKDVKSSEKIDSKKKKAADQKESRQSKHKSSTSDETSRSRRKDGRGVVRSSSESSDSNSSSRTSRSSSQTSWSDNSSTSSNSTDSATSRRDARRRRNSSSRSSDGKSRSSSGSSSAGSSKKYFENKSPGKHEKNCRCKKCKERYGNFAGNKSAVSKGKGHDAARSPKASSSKSDRRSTNKQRSYSNDTDSSDQESNINSKDASGRKREVRSSKKSRDSVGDGRNRSKSSSKKGIRANRKKSCSDQSDSYSIDGSKVSLTKQELEVLKGLTTSSISASPAKKNQQPVKSSSKPTTPRIVHLTPRNTQNAGTTPSPVVRYEWQFQDDQGTWITYGQSSINGGTGYATTASSDDIEEHYHARIAVQIKSNSFQYVLDFQTMTQTNVQTSVQRPIRRVRKQAVKPAALPKKIIVASAASVQYEWQFKDEHGAWIRYGSPNTGGDLSCATTTSSDDIEKYYSNDPDKTPLLIQSNSHQYILDFQAMTQTNQGTFAQRQIRRVLKQAVKPKSEMKSSSIGAVNTYYEWQFQDEHGAWIRYGSANTVGDLSCVTTTSDDIEKHYSSDPLKSSILVESKSHKYMLDFQAMTQTNQKTSVQRPIRRVGMKGAKRIVMAKPKLKYRGVGAVNYQHEWQFRDEHGAWIRYGSPNSGGDLSCVTTTTSDDIEEHYSNNPNSSPLTIQSNSYQYLLDFQNMTQTNQTSMSQRPIRRVPAQTSLSSSIQNFTSRFLASPRAVNVGQQSALAYEWFFLDENNSWISYGQPNSLNKTDCVTSATSDHIERQYQQNPNQCIDIASQKHQYRLDFTNMTQTNKQTRSVRKICRKLKIQQGLNVSARYSGANRHSTSSSDSVPSNWCSMAHSSSAWTAIPLSASDPEYIKHIGIIKKSVPSFNVRRMLRVQNPFLWKAYVNKKDYMNKQNPGIRFREEYLYHGTDPKNVNAICEENIDWRLHGTSHGQSQGRGAYFAKSPQLATSYAGQAGVMFIVKVLVGHITRGSANTVKPPKDSSGKPYDTTVDNEANPNIFVKYDSQEYYPEYYVEF